MYTHYWAVLSPYNGWYGTEFILDSKPRRLRKLYIYGKSYNISILLLTLNFYVIQQLENVVAQGLMYATIYTVNIYRDTS